MVAVSVVQSYFYLSFEDRTEQMWGGHPSALLLMIAATLPYGDESAIWLLCNAYANDVSLMVRGDHQDGTTLEHMVTGHETTLRRKKLAITLQSQKTVHCQMYDTYSMPHDCM